MSEFLHSLRNNTKRVEKQSRHYNPKLTSRHERGSGEFSGNIKRSQTSPNHKTGGPDLSLLLSEFLVLFTIFVEEHTEHKKQMAEIAKRSEASEEKTAQALREISLILSKVSGTKIDLSQTGAFVDKEGEEHSEISTEAELNFSPPPHSSDSKSEMPAGMQLNFEGMANDRGSGLIPEDAALNHIKRTEVMEVIRTLRNNGKSFNMVAEYLEAEHVPTFSGRGRWYASTVANLLKA